MANLGSFMSGAAGGATVAIVIKAVDQYSKEFDKAKTGMDKFRKAAEVAAVGVTGVFAAFTTQAAKFEKTQIAFRVMLGDARKAEKMLKDLAEFSKRTPFKLSELEENARLLLGMGIEADNLIPTMKALGDVSSGLNVPFERMALNFGQVKAQGRLLGTELRDFARAGVPIIQELAKNMNVTEAEIKDLSSQGKITYEDVRKAFQTMTDEGGTFANLMEESMDTALGGISNFQDGVEKLSRSMGEMLLPTLKSVVGWANDLLESYNNLDDKTKDLVNTGVLVGGGAVIAAGATSKIIDIASKLRGSSPANPVFVSDVTKGVGSITRGIGTSGLAAAVPWVGASLGAAAIGAGIGVYSVAAGNALGRQFNAGQPLGPYTEAEVQAAIQGPNKGQGTTPLQRGVLTQEQLKNIINPAIEVRKEEELQIENTGEKLQGLIEKHLDYENEMKILQKEFDEGTLSAEALWNKTNDLNNKYMDSINAITALDDAQKNFVSGAVESMMALQQSSGRGGGATYEAQTAIIKAMNRGGRVIFSKGVAANAAALGYKEGADYTVGDFLMKSDGTVIQFSPDDNIMGWKGSTPPMGGGVNVNIESVYGMDPDEIAQALRTQLNDLVVV